MTEYIMGWDVGGAHLKAALLDSTGRIITIQQQPCALWQGLQQLQQAIDNIMAEIAVPLSAHSVTMTGELVDLFASRADGILQIISTLQACLSHPVLQIYAGKYQFIAAEEVGIQHFEHIASANWLASASLVAQRFDSCVFVDVGSTTTDILLCSDGNVITQNITDYQRLCSGELVYTGVVRTAVMAVAQEAIFRGMTVGLMAEYFATMADIYRVTGELHPAHDQHDTADGQPKTLVASCRRLARMIGCDYTEQASGWCEFAENIGEQQVTRIKNQCQRQIQRSPGAVTTMVGAGVGRFLVQRISLAMGLQYVDFSELLPGAYAAIDMDTADCAPAVAVALLYSHSIAKP